MFETFFAPPGINHSSWMTLKDHNALCNANRAVLWLNGKSEG